MTWLFVLLNHLGRYVIAQLVFSYTHGSANFLGGNVKKPWLIDCTETILFILHWLLYMPHISCKSGPMKVAQNLQNAQLFLPRRCPARLVLKPYYSCLCWLVLAKLMDTLGYYSPVSYWNLNGLSACDFNNLFLCASPAATNCEQSPTFATVSMKICRVLLIANASVCIT